MASCVERSPCAIELGLRFVTQTITSLLKIMFQKEDTRINTCSDCMVEVLNTDNKIDEALYCMIGRRSMLTTIHERINKSFPMIDGNQYYQNIFKYVEKTNDDEDIYFDIDALQIIDEISNNLQWKTPPKTIYHLIGNKQRNKCVIFMRKYNLELNQREYIAIKLWSLSERLTKHYHIDCENNESFKWKLFVNALTTGITKIYKAVIINILYDNENKIFPSLPESLYRGTKVFDPNCNIYKLDTILSFTSSLSIAKSFGKSSKYNKQNKICILNIINAKQYLLNGQLIAAPIGWLSMFSTENEWIVLPSISTFYVTKIKYNKLSIIADNMYKLMLTNDSNKSHE